MDKQKRKWEEIFFHHPEQTRSLNSWKDSEEKHCSCNYWKTTPLPAQWQMKDRIPNHTEADNYNHYNLHIANAKR